MVLAGEGHADQALVGGGEQQRPDGTVDDGVGDVEDALGGGLRDQSVVEAGQGRGRDEGGQAANGSGGGRDLQTGVGPVVIGPRSKVSRGGAASGRAAGATRG